jgi:hypothetical protein
MRQRSGVSAGTEAAPTVPGASSSSSKSSKSSSVIFSSSNVTTPPLPRRLLDAMAQANTVHQGLPPLRALSAYNFFFRDERDHILARGADGGTSDGNKDDDTANDVHVEFSVAKQEALLQDHWNRDRTQKRRHRKTHGKIDFATLSRLISSRWKRLHAKKKDFYRLIAMIDFERYQRESKSNTNATQIHPQQQPAISSSLSLSSSSSPSSSSPTQTSSLQALLMSSSSSSSPSSMTNYALVVG